MKTEAEKAEVYLVRQVCGEHSGFAAEIKEVRKSQDEIQRDIKAIREGIFGNGKMGLKTRVFVLWCGAAGLAGINAVLWAIILKRAFFA